MKILCCLAALVIWFTCSEASITLVQRSSQLAAPGSSVSLECTVSGYNIGDNHLAWVQQVPEGPLLFVAAFRAGYSDYVSSAYKDRVSGSANGNTGQITIRGLTTADTAMYYCARDWVGFDVWGKGTWVQVTTVTAQAPSLFPLIGCGASSDPVVIGCLAKDFLPDSATFSWNDKSNSSFTNGLANFPSIMVSSGGLYTASSKVQVTPESWKNKDPYYCKVTHPALGQPLTKKLVIAAVQRISQPTVTLHPPSREDIGNNNATVVCICRGFYPQPISVKWLQNGKEVSSGVRTEVPVADSEGNFDVTSWLDVTPGEWNRNSLFSCMVDHTASKFWNTKNISKSLTCDESVEGAAKLTVFTVPPTFQEVFESKSPKLTCIVTNMASTDNLNITWSREDTKEGLKTVITDKVLHDNGTYSATGITTVCADQWDAGYKFACKVLHQDLAGPRIAFLQKQNGHPTKAPTIHVYPPTSEEIALKESVTMTCLAEGYNPCDSFVKWMDNGKQVSEQNYVSTKPVEEVDASGNKFCFSYSKLKVPERDWSSGHVYTCVVGHEALALQVIQKSMDKSSGKPTSINVSLVMSDATSSCY